APLRDAVAHGRYAACHLSETAGSDHGVFELWRIVAERLVRRQHVVVAGDDREVGFGTSAKVRLLARLRGGKAVGEVGASEAPACRTVLGRRAYAFEICRTPGFAAVGDALRHLVDRGVDP